MCIGALGAPYRWFTFVLSVQCYAERNANKWIYEDCSVQRKTACYHQGRHPVALKKALKLEHSDPIWDSRRCAFSFDCFYFLATIAAPCRDNRGFSEWSGPKVSKKFIFNGSNIHNNYWSWTPFAVLCLQITIEEVYFAWPTLLTHYLHVWGRVVERHCILMWKFGNIKSALG